MAFKGTIKPRTKADIIFKAGGNQGATALAYFFSSKQGAHVPPPVIVRIVSGGTEVQEVLVPEESETYSLQIDVDLPDGGSGHLEVKQEGITVVSEKLRSDVRWVFWVTQS